MSRFTELKSALDVELKNFKGAFDAVQVNVNGDTVTIDEKGYATLQGAKRKVEEIKSLMIAEGEMKDVQAWLDQPESAPSAFGGGFAQPQSQKDLGTIVTESKQFRDMLETGSSDMRSAVEINEADIVSTGRKDVWSGTMTGTIQNNLGTSRLTLPTQDHPRLTSRVRDLFPVARTNANLIDYFKVMGFTTNGGRGNAAPVAEYENGNFGLKPKSQLVWEQAQASIRTIAHWEAAHRNILADQPQLKSVINSELLYGLALAEDNQLLNGDGTGNNLLGLLNTPGIQTYTQPGTAAAPTEQKSDSLRRAATLCALAFFPATGYVMHPNDWEDIELQKAAGDGHYMLVTNIAVGAQTRVWRLPVVETPAIPEKTFLAAAFGQATKLYDREQANIRISEHHQDFFIRNAIAILCEERIGLVVSRPEAVVKGTFVS